MRVGGWLCEDPGGGGQPHARGEACSPSSLTSRFQDGGWAGVAFLLELPSLCYLIRQAAVTGPCRPQRNQADT